MRVLDLSVSIKTDLHADPPTNQVEIEYRDHDQTAAGMVSRFPGLRIEDLPERKAWAVEHLKLSTHNGTHVDAPWHYHPTMDHGTPAMTIDQVPLDWFIKPGLKLDFRHFPDGYVATPSDVDNELARVGYRIKPLDIVLVNTSAGARYAEPGYVDSGCGLGRDATLHLTSQGVRVVGTDAWSWDAPFSHTARRFHETGDSSIIWEGHKAGREVGYCQIEKLTCLNKLPAFGFTVICMPVKIRGASAGWTRAVAVLEGEPDVDA